MRCSLTATRRGWRWTVGVLLCLAATAPAQEGRAVPAQEVKALPAAGQPDPGPQMVVGAEEGLRGGTRFLWAGATVPDEASSYRLYFDRQDNDNYHFLDRNGRDLTLGLCEAGVEQVLAQGPLPLGSSADVRLARHGEKIGVYQGMRLVLAACDDRCLGGTLGIRGRGPGPLPELKTEKHEDIRFMDDFMREEGGGSKWRHVKGGPDAGEFAIRSLRNPLLSANAFCYMGVGHNALSVTGESWWDNYRYEASLRGPEGSRIGLIFAWQNERNYGLFRWTARALRPDGVALTPGLRELVRVREGKEEVVEKSAGGFLPNQWYRAEILTTHSRVRVTVDGHALFETFDPFLAAGAVGVWCDVERPESLATDPTKSATLRINSLFDLMKQHAVVDDVKVVSVEGFEDDFRIPGPLSHGWLTGLGDWEVKASEPGRPGLLQVAPPASGAKSLIGSRQWGQYRLACDVDPGEQRAGLVFLHRDEANHYVAQLDGAELVLLQVQAGESRQVARAPLRPPGAKAGPGARDDGFVRLGVSIRDGHIKVVSSTGGTVEAFDERVPLRGRAGLWVAPLAADRTGPARFRRFRLLFIEEPEPLVSTNPIFEDEDSMRDWTSASREWLPQQTPESVGGQGVTPYWHISQFPGDVELILERGEVLEEQHEVALSVSKDGKGRGNGYVFLYQAGRVGDKGEKFTQLSLKRQGQAVMEKALPEGTVRELASVSVRRAGDYVIGELNGRPQLVFHDPQPLKGARVAYYTKGVSTRAESIRILSEHGFNELFSRAPAEWRMAGNAIAEVTNRWQCDPRWSFFSLKNDTRKGRGPAVLWSKRLFPGDVTVEFYVGNKMEEERGTPYRYARDINVTVCSDGQDLTKGYTFSFGGRGNEATMIYRNAEEKKRVIRTIPTEMQRIHRAWMSVRCEKRGNRLSLYIDKLPGEAPVELVFEDPEPLAGKRVALWTYDHALMISRVRISGEGGTVMEDPDEVPGPLRTIYDVNP